MGFLACLAQLRSPKAKEKSANTVESHTHPKQQGVSHWVVNFNLILQSNPKYQNAPPTRTTIARPNTKLESLQNKHRKASNSPQKRTYQKQPKSEQNHNEATWFVVQIKNCRKTPKGHDFISPSRFTCGTHLLTSLLGPPSSCVCSFTYCLTACTAWGTEKKSGSWLPSDGTCFFCSD